MLSVLIPVYNFDIRPLVRRLHEQCTACDIAFEILCIDDGSRSNIREANATLTNLTGVIYQENEQNAGRSAIRNQLADQASYPYLIFMDGDSGVVSDHYIKTYLKHLNPDTLFYGGTFYQETAPDDKALIFHWTYGRKREALSLAERQKVPWHAFKTNNFLIPKAIFQQVRFDERLTQYGHEDTIFALELKQRMIRIEHLDNPLEHLGLEPVDRFLEKTQKAVANLYFLWQTGSQIDTRLLRMFSRLKKWKLAEIGRVTLGPLQPWMRRNFRSANPSMTLFDLYKLALMLVEDNKNW